METRTRRNRFHMNSKKYNSCHYHNSQRLSGDDELLRAQLLSLSESVKTESLSAEVTNQTTSSTYCSAQTIFLHRLQYFLHQFGTKNDKNTEGQTLVIIHRHKHVRHACLVSYRVVSDHIVLHREQGEEN